ncbi:MAG: hypothetical protein MMC33_000200 [Icmadophila ericetorum]|nr:hypothetical protein [Icmadophila ericetorum]
MAFCITFGTHDFNSELEEYKGVTAQCHNCGNWSAHVITQWPFFTLCFIPLIPLATHKYKLVTCPICRFTQDLSTRPDIQSQHADAVNPQGGIPPSGQPGPKQSMGLPPQGPPGSGGGQITGGGGGGLCTSEMAGRRRE